MRYREVIAYADCSNFIERACESLAKAYNIYDQLANAIDRAVYLTSGWFEYCEDEHETAPSAPNLACYSYATMTPFFAAGRVTCPPPMTLSILIPKGDLSSHSVPSRSATIMEVDTAEDAKKSKTPAKTGDAKNVEGIIRVEKFSAQLQSPTISSIKFTEALFSIGSLTKGAGIMVAVRADLNRNVMRGGLGSLNINNSVLTGLFFSSKIGEDCAFAQATRSMVKHVFSLSWPHFPINFLAANWSLNIPPNVIRGLYTNSNDFNSMPICPLLAFTRFATTIPDTCSISYTSCTLNLASTVRRENNLANKITFNLQYFYPAPFWCELIAKSTSDLDAQLQNELSAFVAVLFYGACLYNAQLFRCKISELATGEVVIDNVAYHAVIPHENFTPEDRWMLAPQAVLDSLKWVKYGVDAYGPHLITLEVKNSSPGPWCVPKWNFRQSVVESSTWRTHPTRSEGAYIYLPRLKFTIKTATISMFLDKYRQYAGDGHLMVEFRPYVV